MTLLVCRRCNKIIASGSEPCPYCGEPHPAQRAHVADAVDKEGLPKNIVLGLFVLLFLVAFLIAFKVQRDSAQGRVLDADTASRLNCAVKNCPAGSKGATYANLQDPYYACNSDALSVYANFVLGLMIAQAQAGGDTPRVSGSTGEPEAQGKDKTTLDDYRTRAGVPTFEAAIAQCYRNAKQLQATVLDNPPDSNSILVVTDDDPDHKLWMPKSRLIER